MAGAVAGWCLNLFTILCSSSALKWIKPYQDRSSSVGCEWEGVLFRFPNPVVGIQPQLVRLPYLWYGSTWLSIERPVSVQRPVSPSSVEYLTIRSFMHMSLSSHFPAYKVSIYCTIFLGEQWQRGGSWLCIPVLWKKNYSKNFELR